MPETIKLYKTNHHTTKNNLNTQTKKIMKNFNLIFVRKILIWTIIVTIITGCSPTQNNPNQNPQQNNSTNTNTPPNRIISTTPAITELLFEIGLGDKIVGDSQFTTYPPEAEKIEKIGGLYDKNIEKIISLKPDLVICPIEDTQFQQQLKELKIKSLPVDHRSIAGLLESYELVGEFFDETCQNLATQKQQTFKNFLQENKTHADGLKKLRVLTVIDRQRGMGRIDNVFIAGTELFFGEVLSLAGGENVAANIGVPYPNISIEAIIDFNPDVIIDIQIIAENDKITEQMLRSDWEVLRDVVPAVKQDNIFILTDGYATIPGPRIPLLVKKIREILDSCRNKNTPPTP